MPAVFLNYHDVRKLVSALGEKFLERPYILATDLVIAQALGSSHHSLRQAITVDSFHEKPSADAVPLDVTGVQLTYTAYSQLRHAIATQKLDLMKNTERLEVVAGILGWKADALMHWLKTTTSHLGRNPSIPGPYEVPPLSKLIGSHAAEWCHLLDAGPGLFLISGKTGSGITTTLMASLKYLSRKGNPMLWAASTQFGEDTSEYCTAVDGEIPEIIGVSVFSREDAVRALELSKTKTVVATLHADSYHEAYTGFQKLVDNQRDPISTLRAHLLRRRQFRQIEIEMTVIEDRTFSQGWVTLPN